MKATEILAAAALLETLARLDAHDKALDALPPTVRVLSGGLDDYLPSADAAATASIRMQIDDRRKAVQAQLDKLGVADDRVAQPDVIDANSLLPGAQQGAAPASLADVVSGP